MRPARFYQIRLPFEADNITSPWGKTSTGVTGRYLFSPDIGWHYCSPQRLVTFELLDVDFERPDRFDESDDEAEWWLDQADELLRECWDDAHYSSDDVCGPQPDDLLQHRELRGKFTAAVLSSDVDIIDDDGDERKDSDIWDEAREHAFGNWRV